MEYKVEKVSNNLIKVIVTVPNSELLKAENEVFNRKKSKIKIAGFRKGHITKQMAYKVYGKDVFLEDATYDCINNTIFKVLHEKDIKALSRPKINIVDRSLDKDLVYEAEIGVIPSFELPKYKGLLVEQYKVNITDKQVDAYLIDEQEKNSRLISIDNRPIKNGDIVTIDFEGFVNGKPFDGGKAEKYSLTIGSHTFIDNFEEQLVNHNINDEVDVVVTFPKPYDAKNLEGKEALFKVKIFEIKEKELPNLDDEFASEISDFETLDELKKDIKEKLIQEATEREKRLAKNKLINQLVSNTNIDFTQESIEFLMDNAYYNARERFDMQGLKLEDYLKYCNMTMEMFKNNEGKQAIYKFKSDLILKKIAEEESINPSEKDIDNEIEKMAKGYNVSKEKFVENYISDDEMKNIEYSLKIQSALEFVYNNANIKEIDKNVKQNDEKFVKKETKNDKE